MAKGWTDERPMSPHMSVWKWHPTMLSSILHRASGVVLYHRAFEDLPRIGFTSPVALL